MRHPFGPVSLALCAGIAFGTWTMTIAPVAIVVVVAGVLSVAAYRARVALAFLCAISGGFFATGSLLGATATRAALHPPLRELMLTSGGADAFDEPSSEPIWIRGRLRADAAPSSSGTRLSVAVEHAEPHGELRPARGGVILTVVGSGAAERLAGWRAGRTIRVPVILRRPTRYLDPAVPDQELALARHGTTFVGTVKSGMLVEVIEKGGLVAELAASARRAVRAAVGRHVGRWSTQSAGIVVAILIGDRTGLDDEVERRLQIAGTYHVIAISGGNVAILAGLLLWCLRGLGHGPRTSNAIAIVVLLAYGFTVEGGSSVARATIMAITYLAARMLDQRSPPLNSVAVSAAVVLAFDPLALFDAGFLLTFGATMAILVGVPRLLERWPRATRGWTTGLSTLFAASLSAEAALMPVTASVFSRVTFTGLALNFLAIPLMTVVQLTGLFVVLIASIAPPMADAVGYSAHLASVGLVESARLADWMPLLSRRVPAPSWAIVIVYYSAWITWLYCATPQVPDATRDTSDVSPLDVGACQAPTGATPEDRLGSRTREAGWLLRLDSNFGSHNRAVVRFFGSESRWTFLVWTRRTCVILIALTGLWIATGGISVPPRSRLRVTMIDVGQGDAILVQFPNGRSLLIDAGGLAFDSRFDLGARVVAPVLWARAVRSLDYVALTHGDPDHVGGAASVLSDFVPREVWAGVPVPRSEPLTRLMSQAADMGTAWRTLQSGDALSIGAVEVRVVHPPLPDWERQRVRNDDSLVMAVRFGEVSILLTGDIGREIERQIMRTIEPAALRLVKIPHHGSVTSSSREFIEAIRPAVAFVSAGRGNRFGHPADAVLARYREAGVAVFRTDRDGAITIETNGKEVEVTTWTGRRLTLKVPEPRGFQSSRVLGFLEPCNLATTKTQPISPLP